MCIRDRVKTAVHAYAAKWVEQGLVPAEFLAYVQDETKITFPWSMIDKITPRPDAKVQQEDGFERYDYYLSAADPDELLIVEEWDSEAQQQALSLIHI